MAVAQGGGEPAAMVVTVVAAMAKEGSAEAVTGEELAGAETAEEMEAAGQMAVVHTQSQPQLLL